MIRRLAHVVTDDARRRFNSEPTEDQAIRLFLVALPVGVALILIAVGNGFGYRPW